MWHLGSLTTYRQFTTRRGDGSNKSRYTAKEAIAQNNNNNENDNNNNNNNNNSNNNNNNNINNNNNNDDNNIIVLTGLGFLLFLST